MMSSMLPIGYIGELTCFDDSIAADLGMLMRSLSSHWDGRPIPPERLQEVNNKATTKQLVAVEERDGRARVVGAASISKFAHSFDDKLTIQQRSIYWLDSFVTHPDVRGMGIGGRLWNHVLEIAKNEGISAIQFDSHKSRSEAHEFYKAMGARIYGQITRYKKTEIQAASSIEMLNNFPGLVVEPAFELHRGNFVIVMVQDHANVPGLAALDTQIAAHNHVSCVKFYTPFNSDVADIPGYSMSHPMFFNMDVGNY